MSCESEEWIERTENKVGPALTRTGSAAGTGWEVRSHSMARMVQGPGLAVWMKSKIAVYPIVKPFDYIKSLPDDKRIFLSVAASRRAESLFDAHKLPRLVLLAAETGLRFTLSHVSTGLQPSPQRGARSHGALAHRVRSCILRRPKHILLNEVIGG